MFSLMATAAIAEEEKEWTLSRDRRDIKVYTRRVEGIDFKQYRGLVIVDASLSSLVALFEDHSAAQDWIDTCRSIELVERIAPNESISYSYNPAPWPAKDRDAAVHNLITQDPETLVVRIVQQAVPDRVPPNRKAVRVKRIEGLWIFNPLGEKETEVIYQVLTDPGGGIPAWLVNAVAISQPFNTLEGLRDLAPSDKYKDAHFDFITDWTPK